MTWTGPFANLLRLLVHRIKNLASEIRIMLPRPDRSVLLSRGRRGVDMAAPSLQRVRSLVTPAEEGSPIGFPPESHRRIGRYACDPSQLPDEIRKAVHDGTAYLKVTVVL